MAEEKDEEIALRVQQGDLSAFGTLVERFEPKLLRYVKKFLFDYEDTRDLVQEIFIKAYTNIQSFDTKRSFSSWIYRIAHNEAINAIKKKGREPLSFFDIDTVLPHLLISNSKTDDPLNQTADRQMVEKYLKKLDAKYREPLVLYYYEDMDYKEISDIMHIPTSTVGVRIKRAKQLLHKFYQEHNTV
jgi:RNA polymerase sigma-70 factor (ECF subfamily)